MCQKRDDILYEEKCGLNFPDFIIFDLDPAWPEQVFSTFVLAIAV